MLQLPVLDSLQRRLQPLFLLGNQIHSKAPGRHSGPAAATMQTAAGVTHALQVVTTVDDLWRSELEQLRPHAEQLLRAELPARMLALQQNPVALFIEHLVPNFVRRDFAEELATTLPAAPAAVEVDWGEAIAAAIRDLPRPQLPAPSAWFAGRVWDLAPDLTTNAGYWRVNWLGQTYRLPGGYRQFGTIAEMWRQSVNQHLVRTATALAARHPPRQTSDEVQAAANELQARGFLERGDLILIPGRPARLGYIIPDHTNLTLGRYIRRNLAITAAFDFPLVPYPSTGDLQVMERTGSGWTRLHLPNGLCLGAAVASQRHDSPALALAAYLRWAAFRIATNQSFHANDLTPPSSDDPYS